MSRTRITRPAQPREPSVGMDAVSRQYRPTADAPAASAPAPDGHWPHGRAAGPAPAQKITAVVTDGDGDGDEADPSLQMKRVFSRAAETGVSKPAGVAASAFEAGAIARQEARQEARKAKPRLAPLDLDRLVIETDVPLHARRDTATDALAATIAQLLARMQPGHSVLLDSGHGQAVVRWARRHRLGVRKRVQPDGAWRVWRMPDPEPDTPQAPA